MGTICRCKVAWKCFLSVTFQQNHSLFSSNTMAPYPHPPSMDRNKMLVMNPNIQVPIRSSCFWIFCYGGVTVSDSTAGFKDTQGCTIKSDWNTYVFNMFNISIIWTSFIQGLDISLDLFFFDIFLLTCCWPEEKKRMVDGIETCCTPRPMQEEYSISSCNIQLHEKWILRDRDESKPLLCPCFTPVL